MNELTLALDCSLRWTNVALAADGDILFSQCLDIGRRQAAELPLIAERALLQSQRTFDDLGLIAVTNGPGYFTGIRIGVSYAAGLAYGLGIKILPVSTLQMLAYPDILRSHPVLAVVYAGRGHVYAASFGCGNDLPAGEYKGVELKNWLSDRQDVLVVSDDPQKAAESSGLDRDIRHRPPDAAAVARIACENPNTAVSPMELTVSYHREPQTC